MKISRFIFAITLGLCLTGQYSWAEKAYVSDSFRIPFRTGPGNKYKIPIMLRSGQPVEVLGSEGEWSHVRVLGREKNYEGWIESLYIIKRVPWEQQARSLGRENAQVKEKLVRIEKELKETGGREQEAFRALKETSRDLGELQKKYEALEKGSANYLKLKTDYDATKTTLMTNQKKVEDLTRANDILQSSQRHKWFGMGGLVLLCGLLIGLMMGRHQKKKKSTILFD
jgi:SH3 domain protein